MAAEENKALVRRLVEEAVNHRNLDVLDEVADGERWPRISAARAPTSGSGAVTRRPARIDEDDTMAPGRRATIQRPACGQPASAADVPSAVISAGTRRATAARRS